MISAVGQMIGRGRLHQTRPASAFRHHARRGALKAGQHQGGQPGTGYTSRPGTKTPEQDKHCMKHEAADRDNGGYGKMYTSIMAETMPWEYGGAQVVRSTYCNNACRDSRNCNHDGRMRCSYDLRGHVISRANQEATKSGDNPRSSCELSQLMKIQWRR